MRQHGAYWTEPIQEKQLQELPAIPMVYHNMSDRPNGAVNIWALNKMKRSDFPNSAKQNKTMPENPSGTIKVTAIMSNFLLFSPLLYVHFFIFLGGL